MNSFVGNAGDLELDERWVGWDVKFASYKELQHRIQVLLRLNISTYAKG